MTVDVLPSGTLAVNSAVKSKTRRPNGTGSYAYLPSRDCWRACVWIEGRRVYLYGLSKAALERQVFDLRSGRAEPPKPRAPRRPPRSAPTPLTRREVILRALDDASAHGWDRETLVGVLLASLAPERLRLGIYGPCFYCGDIFANTVDHLRARSRGGRDNKGNLVSACITCNLSKGNRLPHEFTPVRR